MHEWHAKDVVCMVHGVFIMLYSMKINVLREISISALDYNYDGPKSVISLHSTINMSQYQFFHTHTRTHSPEIDMDVDEFSSGQVDRLNVLALDYGILAGAYSK